ncbi:MAG: CDP-alcohol phosphatidyltransferase family protein [Sphingopyxis sp.]|nr:CDP-alcohol phosphatidyltransferase family protein [Sphingopyxis sp.]
MFDARLRPLIDPPLNAAGHWLAARGVSANALTIFGLLFGLAAAGAVSQRAYGAALALILVNRILDGLDGAVARVRGPSDFGGYLDSLCDFAFYVAVPIGFAFAEPANALPAAILIASFTITGVSFLAFAAIAAKRGLETSAHGKKSFFYSTGIAEGAETIAVFVLMCVMPAQFTLIAYAYAALCLLTVAQRSRLALDSFR